MEMDIFEALFTRRSIRKYTQEDVSDEDLNIAGSQRQQPAALALCGGA